MQKTPSVLDILLNNEDHTSPKTSIWNMKLPNSEKSAASNLEENNLLMSSYLLKRSKNLSLKKKWFFLSKDGNLYFKRK